MVSKDKVRELIKDYSAEKFAAVIKLCCAPAIFADADKTVSVEFEKGAKQKVRILGVVTDLPGEKGSSAPLLVADIDLGGRELTERSSRTRQFKIARKTLEALFDNPPVQIKGFLTQGIFAFHDNDGHFRVSLVTATAEKGSFKYSSAKRQSFYVTPNPEGNATFVQRMTMDWSSLAAIKGAFSVDRLTRQFYNEIQNWYFWAQLPEQHVSFPNDINDDTDDAKFNGENLIRLITRMVFTWFLKEKGLVNPNLFDSAFLKDTLVKFDPSATVEDPAAASVERECCYYRAILQNLFFATFNQEIMRREFVDDTCNDKKRHSIKTYYRNGKLFAEKDPKKVLAIFNSSPFVNGGLFECLDNVVQRNKGTGLEKTYCWDGFSNHLRDERRRLKSAVIPNRLFFSGETTCDLSSFIEGKGAKNVKVRGLIRILESYNFTIEENSPTDEEVALDPELLGKVFENLLGCFNPETQKMARNSTGSFYTPREEVNYMVGESLVAYLKRALKGIPESEIRQLVAGGAELDDLPKIKARVKEVLAAIFRMKILDPACGSGAFPMGVMLVIVEMLRTLDPDNKLWRTVVIDETKKAVAEIDDEKEREAILAEIEQSFDEKMRSPDYARKLYVIQHCIFGSDIQPIAVQISRLRFFISLLCEQKRTDDPAENYGVTPLPNLENNFVAANSLLSIDLSDMRELLKRQNIARLIRELRETRHRLFLPKTSQQKAALKEKDRKLCDKIDAAAVTAYDEQITQNIAKYKKELADAKKKRDSLSPKELAAPVFDVVVADDLFGGESKVMNAKLTRGKQLDDMISAYEKKIAAIGNLDRKRVLLDNIRRLVKWNPFAFNVAEDFLDPEWMFGVKEGFDIVIGNPPYVKLEQIKDQSKVLEKAGYEVFLKRSDLYCLFTERGMKLLRQGGVLSYIMSNKWLQAEYGEPLRKFFLKNRLLTLIDFGDNRLFESATVYPCIFLAERDKPLNSVYAVVMKYYDEATFIEDIADWGKKLPMSMLSSEAWVLSFVEKELLERLKERCVTLSQFINGEARYGVKPGVTKAFIVDGATKRSIIEGEAKSSKWFGPVVRGRDIQPYFAKASDLWLIMAGYGSFREMQDSHPKLVRWLKNFEVRLRSRGQCTGKSSADHPEFTGQHHWLELDNNPTKEYLSAFALPKIMYQKFQVNPCFVYDESGLYCNDSMWIIPTKEKGLVGLLNSKMGWWLISKYCTQIQNGYQLIWQYLSKIPVPKKLPAELGKKVAEVIAAKKENPAADTDKLESEIDDIVFDLYGLTKEEREIVVKACEKPVKEEKKAKVKGEEVKPKKPVIEEEF